MFNSIKLNSYDLFLSELRQFFAQKQIFFIFIFIFFFGGEGALPHLPARACASMTGGVLGKSCP